MRLGALPAVRLRGGGDSRAKRVTRAMTADFADRTDFDNANRGLIARLEPGVI
jgi:alkyl sulfatase BDS1-like metallo-beta-lactamase superfamily hydrolase